MIVENRPGGAENIAIGYVSKANPDGYTILLCSNSVTINPSLYKNLQYDAKKDLRPIGRVGASPLVIVAQASEPYGTVAEMAAYAKANPDQALLRFAGHRHAAPHVDGTDQEQDGRADPAHSLSRRGAGHE